jgi:hypothetical protein
MGTLGRLWAGRLSGGNTGRLFAELDFSGSGVIGTIGLHDDVHGVIAFGCVGRFEAGTLELTCTPPSPPQPGEPGGIALHGVLDADGGFWGSWTSTGGAEGAFVLFPDPRPGFPLLQIH